MREVELKYYSKLNAIAESNGIVIFGNGEDKQIPLGELKQAFAMEEKLYNRSFFNITVTEAIKLYEETIAPIAPETVLLHIGDADVDFFAQNPILFDNKYRNLLNYIKHTNKDCRIAVISLRNHKNDSTITQLNEHLKYIADSEQCEYGDIADKTVWNPKITQDTIAFVHSTGFVRPLRNKRPMYDLVKMIFGVFADRE